MPHTWVCGQSNPAGAQKARRSARQYQCIQAEAAFIIPEAQRSGTIRLSEVPHTSVCGQHGFYTKNFSLAERRGLQSAEGVVLGDEIGLLRVLIRRFAEQIQASQSVSLYESAQYLAVISEAMSRFASLLRTDHMLGGRETDTLMTQLGLAMNNVLDELRHGED